MKTHKFDGYITTLHDTGRTGEYGKARVEYTFSTPKGELLFSGNDLFASPLHTPEGLDMAKTLLIFLTLQPGDTDDEYFDKYTPEQMEFCNSWECENLQIHTMDDESPN